MPVSDLTVAAQDYLKLIWLATEWSRAPTTVSGLAESLGVSLSTVSEGIRKLADQGFVSHPRYGGIELTAIGREHALMMVRRHRLLETFLVKVLDYAWDEVHDEAEVLEHVVSDTLIMKIDALLDHPARDPHGDPIPASDGRAHHPEALKLSAAVSGQKVTIYRVSDADPALLRHFAGLGLTPDAELTVRDRRPFPAGMTVRVTGREGDIDLGVAALDAIWVTPALTTLA